MRVVAALAALAVALTSSPALALDQAEIIEICGKYSELAGVVMKRRQQGALLTDVLGTADTSSTIVLEIITGAFEYPHFSTAKIVEQAVVDYSNEVMTRCLKEMRAADAAPEETP